jgi:hypothetical protein
VRTPANSQNPQREYGLEKNDGSERRGCSVWVVMVGFAFLSLSGWARLVISMQSWYWLNRAGVDPGPAYLAVSGALWGLAGMAAFWWIWTQRRGYPLAGAAAALFLALTYWFDRLVFSRPDGADVNFPFALAATLLGMVFTIWVLNPFPELKNLRG